MRFRNASLITKIVLFQLLMVVAAFSIYGLVVYHYQSESERQLIEIRRNDVRNYIAYYYQDLISSYALGNDEKYRELKKRIITEKDLLNINVFPVKIYTQPLYEKADFMYLASKPEAGDPYRVLINDAKVIGSLVASKRAQNIRVAVLWGAAFALLIGVSIVIYTLQIGRPVRRLVRVLQREAPSGDLDAVRRNAGGEIGLIAGEVKGMLVRMQEAARMSSELKREKEINLIRQRIAHDVRSPLSVIKSYVEGIPRPAGDPALAEFYQSTMRSIAKLQEMSANLMDYTKAKQLQRERVNIPRLVADVFSEVKAKAEERGVELRRDGESELVADIDRGKFNRVLVNLVTNGIQAIDGGAGSVAVETTTNDGGTLLMKITDTGKGIARENLPHVFDPFFTEGKSGGIGLGLDYCKQVVEAHGGTIAVESEVGKGTTFIVCIPLCVERAGEHENA